ncbi:MAG TPA: hypothetical protein VGD80_07170, partial [Kofleriaceae bacterium]
WRERRTLPEGGIRATSETLYTLTSLTGSTIEYTSMGLSSGPPQTVDQDGVKVEVTSTRGHAEAKGSVDLSRFAFNAKSSSTFSTTMRVVAPDIVPGGGPSTIEITMAIEVSSAPSPGNASPSAPMTAANAPSPAPASDSAVAPPAANGIASQATAAGPDGVTSAVAPGDGKTPPAGAATTSDGKASPAAATAATDGEAPPAAATTDGKAPPAAATTDGKAPTPTAASPGDSKASPPPTAATTGTPPHATGHAGDDHGAHSAP